MKARAKGVEANESIGFIELKEYIKGGEFYAKISCKSHDI